MRIVMYNIQFSREKRPNGSTGNRWRQISMARNAKWGVLAGTMENAR